MVDIKRFTGKYTRKVVVLSPEDLIGVAKNCLVDSEFDECHIPTIEYGAGGEVTVIFMDRFGECVVTADDVPAYRAGNSSYIVDREE